MKFAALFVLFFHFAIAFAQNKADAFDSGYLYLKQNKYRAAIVQFTDYIQFKPDAYAYYNRGQAYKGIHFLDSAFSDFVEASQRLETFWEAYHQLGEVSLLKSDTNRAINYYSKAIKINSLDISSIQQKCRIYMARMEYQNAEREINQILKINSNHSEALLYKAIICEFKGNLADAVYYYDRVVSLDIKNEKALFNRSMLFVKFENWEAAKQGFGIMMGMNKDNMLYLEKLAEMELYTGQPNVSVELLEKHAKPNQMGAEAYKVYLVSLIRMNKIKEAEQYKKLHISKLQKLTSFVNIEAELLYKQKEYSKCLQKANSVLSSDSTNCVVEMFKILSENKLKTNGKPLEQSLLTLEDCLNNNSEYWYQLALATQGESQSKSHYLKALQAHHFPLADHESLIN